MLKMHELREIIKLLDQSSICEFKMESEGTKLSIKKTGGQTVADSAATSEAAVSPAVQAAPAPQLEQRVAETPVQATEVKPAETKAAAEEDANYQKIVSPMVGTFYSSPEPSANAYVKAGDKVNKDSIVCIIEAMKLFNEIEAEVSGEIVKVLVTDGQLVEYGQPLFLVKPE
jgi:acetyl-CoA carboxylase biotin carboxyl carrier protein